MDARLFLALALLASGQIDVLRVNDVNCNQQGCDIEVFYSKPNAVCTMVLSSPDGNMIEPEQCSFFNRGNRRIFQKRWGKWDSLVHPI